MKIHALGIDLGKTVFVSWAWTAEKPYRYRSSELSSLWC